MIPKLHAKGTSFKGAAAYLLHDKGSAATSGRVAWVETVNLATSNPEAAWRVMAATAMGASRLKEQAGVKKTGRSSKDSVLHMSLSWEPSQRPTRQEMSDFARRAMAALKAGDRQAMIISHADEKHPHVHVLINRVSPTDGRMLSSSNEKLALSALALDYEKQGGTIYCKEREANAAKRKKNEFVRGQKDIPRPEFEAFQEAQKEAEREVPAHIRQQQPELAAQIRASMRRQFALKLDAIKEQLRPQWANLYRRQQGEMEKIGQQKASLVERLRGLFGGRSKAASPAPKLAAPFQKQSLKGAWDVKAQQQKQRGDRVGLAQRYKAEVRKAVGEMKAACQLALRQIVVAHDRGGPAQQFRPAAAGGVSPAPLTPEQSATQRRLSELAEKFRKSGSEKPQGAKVIGPDPPARPRDKDHEREP